MVESEADSICLQEAPSCRSASPTSTSRRSRAPGPRTSRGLGLNSRLRWLLAVGAGGAEGGRKALRDRGVGEQRAES